MCIYSSSKIINDFESMMSITSPEKLWRYRLKDTNVQDYHNLLLGTQLISRVEYESNEWVQFGGKDGRGAWEMIKRYKYFVMVVDGSGLNTYRFHEQGNYSIIYILHTDSHKEKLLAKYDWYILNIPDNAIKRWTKETEKKAAEEQRYLEHKRQEELERERQRIEAEKEAERKREEAIRKEEERLESPVHITTRMWESMQQEIAELRRDLEYLSRFVDIHEY